MSEWVWAPTGLGVEMSLSVLTYFDSRLRIILCSVDTWVLVSTKLAIK